MPGGEKMYSDSLSSSLSSSSSSSSMKSHPELGSEDSSDEDYAVVNFGGVQPYQNEPLAIPGEQRFNFEEDKDGISRESLVSRCRKTIPVA
eukprot:gene13078-14421_t